MPTPQPPAPQPEFQPPQPFQPPPPSQAPTPAPEVPVAPINQNTVAQAPAQPVAVPIPAKQKLYKLLRRLKSRRVLLVTAGVVVLIIAGTFLKGLTSDFKTVSLQNGNYSYTFKFYKSATKTQAGGQNTYTYQNSQSKMIADIQPTNESTVTSCSKLGSKWSQAFTVNVYAASRPVCFTSTGNVRAYDVIFPAQNSNQLFLVTTYGTPESPSIDSGLKTIFESVKL
jgi:hypothetical protein